MKQLGKENILNIQYLDNHLLVVSKDANLLTQPDQYNSFSLESKVKSWIKDKYNKKGNVFLHPVGCN